MAERNIPHGHGLSHKKGISDGLLERNDYAESIHETHRASYLRGVDEGRILRGVTALRVRPEV